MKRVFTIIIFVFISITGYSCSTPNIDQTETIIPTTTVNSPEYQTVELRFIMPIDPATDYSLTGKIDPKNSSAFFNFDEIGNTTAENADVTLRSSCGSDCFNILELINGANSVMFNETEPTYEQCLNAFDTKKTNDYLDSQQSHYSCIRTSAGNIFLIQIIEINNDLEIGIIKLNYTKLP